MQKQVLAAVRFRVVLGEGWLLIVSHRSIIHTQSHELRQRTRATFGIWISPNGQDLADGLKLNSSPIVRSCSL